MRIKCISLTSNDEYKEVSDLTWPTVVDYCVRQGYSFERKVVDKKYLSKPVSWYKLPMILDAMANYDIVIWIDADALILNYEFDLSSLLNESFFYISKDINGLNSGVMMLRSSQRSVSLINKANSLVEYIDHPWWEQAAIQRLYEDNFEEIRDHTTIIDQKLFNAYDYSLYGIEYPEGQVNSGSFVFHLPGISVDKKIPIIKNIVHLHE